MVDCREGVGREGHWPAGLQPPISSQPIIAALVKVKLAGGSHPVAMETGVREGRGYHS